MASTLGTVKTEAPDSSETWQYHKPRRQWTNQEDEWSSGEHASAEPSQFPGASWNF